MPLARKAQRGGHWEGDHSNGGSDTQKPQQRRKPRSVSCLEPDQLQRKRQVDRKAQQALRERTKSRVDALEAQVDLLTHAAEERDREHSAQLTMLREQNRWLGSRLGRISQLACDLEPPSPPVTHQDWQSPPGSVQTFVAGWSADGLAVHVSSDASPAQDPPHASQIPAPENHYQAWSSGSLLSEPPDRRHGGAKGIALHNAIHAQEVLAPVSVPASLDDSSSSSRRGPAAMLCTHLPPTCALDSILVNFYSRQRKLLHEGASSTTVLGSPHPFVSTIVDSGSQPNPHPIGRVIEDVMATFGQISAPEKLGMVFKMHATLSWLIHNTTENYEYMPRWLRPTATQITVPHAAWIDNIPWPGVRDLLIENPVLYNFEAFSEVYSHTVSVNWAYDIEDAVTVDESTGMTVIAPIFEKHARRIKNWTVSKEFEECFPDLAAMTKPT